MTSKLLAMGVVAIVLAISGAASNADLHSNDRADFHTLVGGIAAVGCPYTDFSGGDFSGDVVSQAFTDGADAIYICTKSRTLALRPQMVPQRFTASPFAGASNLISRGYLMPHSARFRLGDQAPLIPDVKSRCHPAVGFSDSGGNPVYLCARFLHRSGKRQHGVVMSEHCWPWLVTGELIDGRVYTWPVVGQSAQVPNRPHFARSNRCEMLVSVYLGGRFSRLVA